MSGNQVVKGGRVPDGTRLSSSTEPQEGLRPAGFDPSRGRAADFFAHFPLPGSQEAVNNLVRETFDGWREKGAIHGRATFVSGQPGETGEGYPHGLWLEGWNVQCECLPFGEAEYEGGPVSPPLTYSDSGSAPEGEDPERG